MAPQKRKHDAEDNHEEADITPKDSSKRLIVVLEDANLILIQLRGKKPELLCADNPEHNQFIKKNGIDRSKCHPEMVHRCLLALMDDPLNIKGYLQVLIHTVEGEVIQINPHIRIPRTFLRFSGLFAQLLHKKKIEADGVALLKVVKNPLESLLPQDCLRMTVDDNTEEVLLPRKVAQQALASPPAVVVVGALQPPVYAPRTISLSSYSTTLDVACSLLCEAFVDEWGVDGFDS